MMGGCTPSQDAVHVRRPIKRIRGQNTTATMERHSALRVEQTHCERRSRGQQKQSVWSRVTKNKVHACIPTSKCMQAYCHVPVCGMIHECTARLQRSCPELLWTLEVGPTLITTHRNLQPANFACWHPTQRAGKTALEQAPKMRAGRYLAVVLASCTRALKYSSAIPKRSQHQRQHPANLAPALFPPPCYVYGT